MSQFVQADNAHSSNARKLGQLVFVYLVLPCLFLAVAVSLIQPGDMNRPQAVGGVLDLRQTDLAQTPHTLDGEWLFFWQQYLSPDSSMDRALEKHDAIVNLPNSWQGTMINGRAIDAKGYASMRLRVLVNPAQNVPLALRINRVNSAYQLWANGQPVAAVGRVATRSDQEAYEQGMLIVPLPKSAGTIDLLLHTSNFQPRPRNMNSIQIGQESALRADAEQERGLVLVMAAILLMMAIYHAALFLFQPKHRPPLFLALHALMWMIVLLTNQNSWPIRLFFPELPVALLYRVFRVTLLLSGAMSFQFIYSLYPQECPRWAVLAFWGVVCFMLILALGASPAVFSATLPLFYFTVAVKTYISLSALTKAMRRSRPGAFIILTGFMLFVLCGLNDSFFDMDILRTRQILSFGMCAFMLAQAIALAQHFSQLLTSVENLSNELGKRNRILENEIAERIQAQRDIVTLRENERSRISHELHDGLCQQLTAARLLCSSLPEGPPSTPKTTIAQLGNVLNAAADHAYHLAKGLWPEPPVSNDLRVALAQLVAKNRQSDLPSVNFVDTSTCETCRCSCTANAFGIAQEALMNAIKHARASQIDIRLACNAGTLELSVVDNGTGRTNPQLSSGGLGLRIMAYRARMIGGEFHFAPLPQGGVQARCSLPCQSPPVAFSVQSPAPPSQ